MYNAQGYQAPDDVMRGAVQALLEEAAACTPDDLTDGLTDDLTDGLPGDEVQPLVSLHLSPCGLSVLEPLILGVATGASFDHYIDMTRC